MLLVYTGWILLVLSAVVVFISGYEFRKKGGVLEGKPVVYTTVLVDSGIYRVIRHPQYLAFMMIVYSFILISQHWLSIISGITGSILFYLDVIKEEKSNIDKFGDDYKLYMQRVPRMNFMVGLIRLLKRKRGD